MDVESHSLKGKVAVITGGSSGIGLALTRELVDQGVSIGVGSRRGSDLDLPNVLSLPCDVRVRSQVARLVAETVDRFGRLDILVANAGVGSYADFLATPAAHVEEMIDTNVKGTIYLLQEGIPHLLTASGGDIVTVASEAGRRGLPGEAVYSASKFAQVGLTRALDNELREKGIRCTAICPGGVATEFAMSDGRGRTEEMLKTAGMMKAEDIAQVIVFTLLRPRHLRVLEVALRPMTEASWG
jgi:3-oxoacyl-[acyl-carrier protein] reductase